MNKKNKKMAIKAGAAGLAAIAAATGAYFLYGKDGKKNRKKIKGWMLKAKGEVLQEMEHMKSMGEDTYHNIIDAMAERYRILKNVDKEELECLIKELKSHWKHIKKEAKAKPEKIAKRK